MTAFISELIQEVANFKKFFHGYQHNGANKLIGLGKIHLFKFYVEEKDNNMGWPIMRYKVILKFYLCELLFSLNGCTSLQIPLLCYFVDVGGPPIHPCSKCHSLSSYPETCSRSILASL